MAETNEIDDRKDSLARKEMTMGNLKKWILSEASGEPIEAVVIGDMGWPGYHLDSIPEKARHREKWHVVLAWSEAVDLLDYDFDAGYGSPGCQSITAWTPSRVIFIVQYDGSTRVCHVPRHPVPHAPDMPGG